MSGLVYNIKEQKEMEKHIGKLFLVPSDISGWGTFQDHGKIYLYTGGFEDTFELVNQHFMFGSLKKTIDDHEHISSLIFKNKTIWTFSPRLFIKSCTQITF